jgi:hypothetical protein
MENATFIPVSNFRGMGKWFGETHFSPRNASYGAMWSWPKTTVWISTRFMELSSMQSLSLKWSSTIDLECSWYTMYRVPSP